MLRRIVEQELNSFVESDVRKCLIVRGARQVGKTYSVERLAQNERVESFIYINFLKTPELKDIFAGNLDTDSLILNFSLYMPQAKFLPGKTVLFLDEIQECPEAITSLKFWAQDAGYRVIASGSMLGIDYKRPSSYPVGSIQYVDMYPLSFREFLWAYGINDSLIDILHNCFVSRTPVSEPIHKQLLNLLKTYMVVGGMPEVVQTYVDTHNMAEVDQKQRAILSDYRYDIAHYAPADDKLKAESCYFSIPDQLSKDNHKFKYSVVQKGGNSRKFGNSLDWLVSADLAHYCKSVSTVEFPLRSFANDDNFRLYPSDIGLLVAMYDYALKTAVITDSTDSIRLGQAKGGLYEALIADMLIKNGHKELYFYKNDTTKVEIEFLISAEQGVLPIEVKAGNNRSRSLDSILKKDEIAYGYKLISGNVGVSDKKISLPLYMAMFI